MPRNIAIAIVDTDQHGLAHNALCQSVERFPVQQVLVYSDRPDAWPGFAVQTIPRLGCIDDYNRLITRRLADDLRCDQALVIQFDGFVLNPQEFAPLFLHHDYIGAPWPQFADGDGEVGNGGFSLRSRRLVDAVAALDYADTSEPEDLFICRRARAQLQAQGLRFAPRAVAAHFSVEHPAVPWPTFGFHGVFHLPDVYRHDLEQLVELLSPRVLQSRAAYLLPAIARLSPQVAARYHQRLAALQAVAASSAGAACCAA